VYSAEGDKSLRHLSSHAIGRALAISVILHLLAVGTLEIGHKLGWWKHSLLPKVFQSRVVEEAMKVAQARQQQAQEPPETKLVFVEVDPSQASTEAPKKAKYYSSQSSLASNPDTKLDTETPEINGRQQQVPKTFDTLHPDMRAPQPKPVEQKKAGPARPEQAHSAAPAPPPKERESPKKEEPPPKLEKGDLLVARAAPPPRPAPKPAEPPRQRPRTLAEARAQKGLLDGRKMKSEGGTRRFNMESSLNVQGSPFGSYDAAFIRAVQDRWYSLLDQRDYVGNSAGKVTLEFRLNKDGRILDMHVAESTVPEFLQWLCQRAVLDPAPYQAFPADLQRLFKGESRDIRFTFYYNQ
jgi:hypothetical protein